MGSHGACQNRSLVKNGLFHRKNGAKKRWNMRVKIWFVMSDLTLLDFISPLNFTLFLQLGHFETFEKEAISEEC